MNKVMISQPMNGISEEEILKTHENARVKLIRNGYEVVDQYLGQCEAINPIACLGLSIETMSECQAVYFCNGWENARGCRIEHAIAEEYGLEVIYATELIDLPAYCCDCANYKEQRDELGRWVQWCKLDLHHNIRDPYSIPNWCTLTEHKLKRECNQIEGDVMNRKLIDQWQKDFHEVVESLDVEKYKAFYRMYQDDVYGGRPMPTSDTVIMASMCKVALALTTISEATKKKADEWLEANNFSKGIWI